MKPIFALFFLTTVLTTPVPRSKSALPEKILYDQRQEGEWNVRADLKDFVIVIIPKTSELTDTSPSDGLMDFFSRKRLANKKKNAMHFLESKTAPYHVDITKSSKHLMNEEILATQAPLVVNDVTSERHLRSVVLTVPEEDFVLTKMEEDKKVVKKDGLNEKEELVLLGATEQCGPEMARDDKGICRLKTTS